MSLVTCNQVILGYEGIAVTKEIDFTIEQGDYLCVVGENGAGKSTLMKALLCLIKPMEGSIVIGDGLKRQEMGYLPQQSGIQKDFPASVMEIVLSGTLNQRKGFFYGKKEKQIAIEKMEQLSILDLKKRCYRDLSGGQQQRVLLARALCATKKILLIDEPVAGLDPAATITMYETLAKLNTQGVTLIMISHDLKAATNYGNKILSLQKMGNFFGTVSEYKKVV